MNYLQALALAPFYRAALKARRNRNIILGLLTIALGTIGALLGALDVWYGTLICTALVLSGIWAGGDAIDCHKLMKELPE